MITKEVQRQMLQELAQRARTIALFDGAPRDGGREVTTRTQRASVRWNIGETAILNSEEIVFRQLPAGRVTHAGVWTAEGILGWVIPLGKSLILNGGPDDILRLKPGQFSIQLFDTTA